MVESNDSARPLRRIRSFVVRAGRMTAGQERAWRDLWPRYGIEFEAKPLDLDAIFRRNAPRMLEIGFGTGDALLDYARNHPDTDCLGVEVHRPGVGHLMLRLEEAALYNVRLICHDAVEVLTHSLPRQSLDLVHIFFPDPWHKKRHHKRRLIQTPFIDLLANAMKPGATLGLATDWQPYAEQMLTVLGSHANFANIAEQSSEAPSGFAARPNDRPLTRFERRGQRLGHEVWDLAFWKVNGE